MKCPFQKMKFQFYFLFFLLKIKCNIDIVKLLLKLGVNVNKSELKEELRLATMYSGIRKVKLIMGLGIDVNSKDRYGWSALSVASLNNKIDIIQYLIDAGANVNEAIQHFSFSRCTDEVKNMLIKANSKYFK